MQMQVAVDFLTYVHRERLYNQVTKILCKEHSTKGKLLEDDRTVVFSLSNLE